MDETVSIDGRSVLSAFRAALDRGLALAELAERLLRQDARRVVTTPAQPGVVTFRYQHPERSATQLDELNARIAQACSEDGFATLSTTKLRGRTVLRCCTINPRSTAGDFAQTIRRLGEYSGCLVAQER